MILKEITITKKDELPNRKQRRKLKLRIVR